MSLYFAHRVIFFLETGRDPGDLEIDHKNHGDNRGVLRLATRGENNKNVRVSRLNNKSGFKGVYWGKGTRRWRAVITVNKKRKHLGVFHSRLEAAWAYNQAAIEHYGKFAKLNVLLVRH